MSSVSTELFKTIKEIQSIESLAEFYLAGGTNLALRINHRQSIDIDLFCSHIIGKEGFIKARDQLKEYFGERFLMSDFPCDINDQFVFLRCLVKSNDVTIKIELIQNMIFTEKFDTLNGVKLVSWVDLGIYKLMAAYNRDSKKDIYDLHYITEQIDLVTLFHLLDRKTKEFSKECHKSIFHLDQPFDIKELPIKLLRHTNKEQKTTRPIHSNDTIDHVDGKMWGVVNFTWISKVRQLFKTLDIAFPSPHEY